MQEYWNTLWNIEELFRILENPEIQNTCVKATVTTLLHKLQLLFNMITYPAYSVSLHIIAVTGLNKIGGQ